MEHWNLPPVYRDIVAYHHLEHYDSRNILLAIVRMVNFNSRQLHVNHYPTLSQAEDIQQDSNPLYVDDTVMKKMEEAMTGSLSH
jgi:hypothetical protein